MIDFSWKEKSFFFLYYGFKNQVFIGAGVNGEVILPLHYLMVSTPSPKEGTHYKVIKPVLGLIPPFFRTE